MNEIQYGYQNRGINKGSVVIRLKRIRMISIGIRLPVGRFLVLIFVPVLLLTLLGFSLTMATAGLLGECRASVRRAFSRVGLGG